MSRKENYGPGFQGGPNGFWFESLKSPRKRKKERLYREQIVASNGILMPCVGAVYILYILYKDAPLFVIAVVLGLAGVIWAAFNDRNL